MFTSRQTMINLPEPCPCQSSRAYGDCCRPLHMRQQYADNAEALMRSRYSGYVLQNIDYILETTVPSQQAFLDAADMLVWSRESEWLGLDVLQYIPNIGKRHAQVEFIARFRDADGVVRQHRELSAFVNIAARWYFIDPTAPLPSMKQPCLCGSEKKFKACCGQFFK